MDPLSITAGSLSIAKVCFTLAKGICDTIEDYRAVPKTLTLIVDTLNVTQGVLGTIQQLLIDQKISALSPELADIFPAAVKGFEAVLLCLEEEFRGLEGNNNWWNRIMTLWKQSAMERLQKNLDRRHTLLQTLIATLQIQAQFDRREHLRRNRSQLILAKDDIISLVEDYHHIAAPIADQIDRMSSKSVTLTQDGVVSTTEFAFDAELINTAVYRGRIRNRESDEKRIEELQQKVNSLEAQLRLQSATLVSSQSQVSKQQQEKLSRRKIAKLNGQSSFLKEIINMTRLFERSFNDASLRVHPSIYTGEDYESDGRGYRNGYHNHRSGRVYPVGSHGWDWNHDAKGDDNEDQRTILRGYRHEKSVPVVGFNVRKPSTEKASDSIGHGPSRLKPPNYHYRKDGSLRKHLQTQITIHDEPSRHNALPHLNTMEGTLEPDSNSGTSLRERNVEVEAPLSGSGENPEGRRRAEPARLECFEPLAKTESEYSRSDNNGLDNKTDPDKSQYEIIDADQTMSSQLSYNSSYRPYSDEMTSSDLGTKVYICHIPGLSQSLEERRSRIAEIETKEGAKQNTLPNLPLPSPRPGLSDMPPPLPLTSASHSALDIDGYNSSVRNNRRRRRAERSRMAQERGNRVEFN